MAARNEDLESETGRDLCRVRRDGERKGLQERYSEFLLDFEMCIYIHYSS